MVGVIRGIKFQFAADKNRAFPIPLESCVVANTLLRHLIRFNLSCYSRAEVLNDEEILTNIKNFTISDVLEFIENVHDSTEYFI